MTCQDFWNSMPEPGQVASDLLLSAHLSECPNCAARMQQQRRLQTGLRALSATERRVGAPARVETRLLVAFRQHEGLPARRVAGRWAPAFVWAAAIAAMLLLGVVLVRNRQPQPVRVEVRHSLELASADSPGRFEGFIPLPNSAGLATENEEDVNLVRVSLPRSAMLALGLEVSEDRAAELVEADIMLGSDGLARAVRFLDSDSLLD